MGPDGYVTADRRARLVIARPRRPPYDAAFSRALDARLDAHPRDARARPPQPTDADEAAAAAAARGVRRRTSHRGRNRSDRPAREHPQHRRLARADSAAAVPRVPQRLAGRWSDRCRRRCRWSSCSACSALPGARLSAAATGAAAMLFGLGVDGVVLLYVAHQLALAQRPRTRRASARSRAPASACCSACGRPRRRSTA